MPTQAERIAKLETKHNMAVNDIKDSIGDIKADIKDIKSALAPMPELIRKVNDHHKDLRDDIKPSMREHKVFVKRLETAGCPQAKVQPEDIQNMEKERIIARRWNLTFFISIITMLIGIAAIYFTK